MASRKWLTEGSLVEVAAPMNDAGLAGSYFRAVVVRRYVRKGKAGSVSLHHQAFFAKQVSVSRACPLGMDDRASCV